YTTLFRSIVDVIVRDAEDDDEDEDRRNERRVQLAGRELSSAAEESVDRGPGEEADEERQGDLHEFREQDTPYHRADDRQDEPGEVAAQGGADEVPDHGAE